MTNKLICIYLTNVEEKWLRQMKFSLAFNKGKIIGGILYKLKDKLEEK